MDCRSAFEKELARRGVPFTVDHASGLTEIQRDGFRSIISLENLEKSYQLDRDPQHIVRFVDAVLASMRPREAELSSDRLSWSLEPNDYADAPSIRSPLSPEVDRVLVHVSATGERVTWVEPAMLAALRVTEDEAAARAFANLARDLSSSEIVVHEIAGAPLAHLNAMLPFKSALMLAPNLKERVGARIGWPLRSVVPARDFLYLWPAKHESALERLGGVVVREYAQAPHPISTEVYEIDDHGVRAIGAFPKPDCEERSRGSRRPSGPGDEQV